MATYQVDKGFRASEESETRFKGEVLELSGDELIFALENKCLTKLKGDAPKKIKAKKAE